MSSIFIIGHPQTTEEIAQEHKLTLSSFTRKGCHIDEGFIGLGGRHGKLEMSDRLEEAMKPLRGLMCQACYLPVELAGRIKITLVGVTYYGHSDVGYAQLHGSLAVNDAFVHIESPSLYVKDHGKGEAHLPDGGWQMVMDCMRVATGKDLTEFELVPA